MPARILIAMLLALLLSLTLPAQGKYTEVERLQRSLAIREKLLGPEHPDVATALSSLAFLYYTRGQIC